MEILIDGIPYDVDDNDADDVPMWFMLLYFLVVTGLIAAVIWLL